MRDAIDFSSFSALASTLLGLAVDTPGAGGRGGGAGGAGGGTSGPDDREPRADVDFWLFTPFSRLTVVESTIYDQV